MRNKHQTAEAKIKISKKRKGMIFSDITKQRMSKSKTGKKLSK